MRIVIADYSGHPFQVQLSRELARRRHSVLHLHFAEFQTPKGRLAVGPDDPKTLAIEPVSLGTPFAKHSFVKRRHQEIAVGRKIRDRIAAFKPDVVVASNLPLDALRIVADGSASAGHAFVFWQQDIYSIAISRIMRQRLGPVGAMVGSYYKHVERSVIRKSHAVVPISADFLPHLERELAVAEGRIHVVENWAPLDEITPRPKDNAWARANGLADKDVVLYSGTLGLKHDPSQILAVAEALRDRPRTEVVVASEGPAAEWLAGQASSRNLGLLRIMGFQPYSVYPDLLGAADVLLSILEADSGIFSVPSKVLSYLCAGRAIVLSAPAENLAARIVQRSGAGAVISGGKTRVLVDTVAAFLADPDRRRTAGEAGRRYACENFNIDTIANKFEDIIAAALRARMAPQQVEKRPPARIGTGSESFTHPT